MLAKAHLPRGWRAQVPSCPASQGWYWLITSPMQPNLLPLPAQKHALNFYPHHRTKEGSLLSSSALTQDLPSYAQRSYHEESGAV